MAHTQVVSVAGAVDATSRTANGMGTTEFAVTAHQRVGMDRQSRNRAWAGSLVWQPAVRNLRRRIVAWGTAGCRLGSDDGTSSEARVDAHASRRLSVRQVQKGQDIES